MPSFLDGDEFAVEVCDINGVGLRWWHLFGACRWWRFGAFIGAVHENRRDSSPNSHAALKFFELRPP